MDEIESDTQSFIVKVWVEDCAEETGHRGWHGHITHVSSTKRRCLKNLGGIDEFISPYLEEMGVQLAIRWPTGCATSCTSR